MAPATCSGRSAFMASRRRAPGDEWISDIAREASRFSSRSQAFRGETVLRSGKVEPQVYHFVRGAANGNVGAYRARDAVVGENLIRGGDQVPHFGDLVPFLDR